MVADSRYDEVHEKTKDTPHYGCWNRAPYRKSYWAPQRIYNPDGSFEVISVRIPDNMSKNCRGFYLWHTDPKCAGCTVDRDYAYEERMRGME